MIARRAGTVVSLGMLIGVIAGCGTQLDPRLQVNAEIREFCTLDGKSYTDDQIRGILAGIEEGRLTGVTRAHAYDKYDLQCHEDFEFGEDAYFLCQYCHVECVNQVYEIIPLAGQ